MHSTIHIDEKWFYMTKGTQRFYLAPGEQEPHRTCKNKKFISKIMFMCAVCRPLFGVHGEVLFDGKIGIFPFTKQVAAKRSSKNKQEGTMETKPIESITTDVVRECLINKILPAIIAKWPDGATKVLKIQQDNARPHIKDNDPAFREAAQQSGFSISIVQQPPNSPDTNVNDLGWFRAIQSLQTQTACNNVDDLVNAVEKSFHELQPETLDNVFLSLQGLVHGNYESPGSEQIQAAPHGESTFKEDKSTSTESRSSSGTGYGSSSLSERPGEQPWIGVNIPSLRIMKV
ncbi:uncharacterized protein LOC121803941 [Salvia splendens]|uniref:uncharacterized protein LOC121803941 n=1 Tax=Salvia splendens TaxID=180675 RepID=UPI001C253261|nr:uncharacterized protein LOC121803941 [Salvia splendens]